MACTFTYTEKAFSPVRKVSAAWTSTSTSGASATTRLIAGQIFKLETIPSTSAAPSANYDITLKDSNGIDLLGNSHDDLANRHTSNKEVVYPAVASTTTTTSVMPVVFDTVTVAVTNAGASKAGTLNVYWIGG